MLLLCSRSHALYNCSANIYMCLFTETCFQTCDHQTIRRETCKAQTYSNQSCPAAFFMSIKQWASHLLQTTCKVKQKLSSNFYKIVRRQSGTTFCMLESSKLHKATGCIPTPPPPQNTAHPHKALIALRLLTSLWVIEVIHDL